MDSPLRSSSDLYLDAKFGVSSRANLEREREVARGLSTEDLAAAVGKYYVQTPGITLFLRHIGFPGFGREPVRVTAYKEALRRRLRE